MNRALTNFHITKWLKTKVSELDHNLDEVDDEEYRDWYYNESYDVDLVHKIDKDTVHYLLNKLFIEIIDFCVENDLCVNDTYLVNKGIKDKFYEFCYKNVNIKNLHT